MSEDTPTPRRRRRVAGTGLRFTRRSASILIALMMVAAPAGASIIVQNYMEADITAAPPCFVKETGTDPTNSTQATFTNDPIASPTNLTPDVITVDNVSLLEEKISVTGMTGDRVIYTDVVRYVNNCDEDITVQLSTTGISGTWTNVAAEIWISESETPAAIDPNLDPVATDDWNDDAIVIPAGSASTFADTTGAVVIPSGEQRLGAFVVSTDVAFTAGTATVNWVASATI